MKGLARIPCRRFPQTRSFATIPPDEIARRMGDAPEVMEKWIERLSVKEQAELAKLVSFQKVTEPPTSELRTLVFTSSIPFVGFGIMDNAILILAGDAIDTSLGIALGISTMCAAAIGNIVSDVAGVMLGTVVEDFCSNVLKLPVPQLTTAQRQLRSVRLANQLGCAIGLVVGCVIGMFPLMFIDSNRIQAKKREASLDALFQDVVQNAGSLIGAKQMTIRLLTDEGRKEPSPEGKMLFDPKENKYSPIGRGIVSRAALTGETWNITNVLAEPDYLPELDGKDSSLCVPVLDNVGRPIAVLQGTGKVFQTSDVQVLKALASHISVSLQRMYDEGDEEMRLKDTITMLKEYRLTGIASGERSSQKVPLFPEK